MTLKAHSPSESKQQKSFAKKLKAAVRKTHPAVFFLWVIISVYFALTLSCLYQRYIYLEMKEPTDTAAYIQTAWTVLKGSPYTVTCQEESAPLNIPHNTLGVQLYFTLALFSPLVLFTSSGVPWLIIQAAIISLAAVPLFFLAERALKDNWLALLITLAYLFNPGTYEAFEKFGFRLETIFIPALFAMFYFLGKDKYIWAGTSLFVAMLNKHNIIMIAFMLGLYYLIFDRKKWRFGVYCLVLAIGYYLVGVRGIIYKYQMSEVASFRHFADFGKTPQEVLLNMARHPAKIFNSISAQEWGFYRRMFLPAGVLALLHPVFWVSLPQLVMNAILRDYHSVYCAWHWAVVVPFLFVSIVYSMKFILERFGQYKYLKYGLFVLLAVNLLYNFADYNQNVLAADKDYYYKQNNIDTSKITDQLAVIEPEASVLASGQLLWFLATREKIYVAREQFHDEADYVAILLPLGQVGYVNLDKYFFDALRPSNSTYLKHFETIVKTPNLLIFKNKNYARIVRDNRGL